jgi:RNA polymerase sigma-70 factor (ECF subfamily)
MDPHEMSFQGRAEARYVAFLETIANLRPSLHRYCSRMTGSIFDGEDLVQEALFQAVGSCVACLAFVAVRWALRIARKPAT